MSGSAGNFMSAKNLEKSMIYRSTGLAVRLPSLAPFLWRASEVARERLPGSARNHGTA